MNVRQETKQSLIRLYDFCAFGVIPAIDYIKWATMEL